MSNDWSKDIHNMHKHYGFHKAVDNLSANQLVQYYDFRVRFLEEELNELKKSTTPDEAIDALIDLCVVAIGTLDIFNVDAKDAWNKVLDANMKKHVGVKESRPNPLGLPDLIKPEDWKAPDHSDQMTDLDFVFLEKWIDKK
jgi:predicted HAD superfamily Cof-like phosphohydrolase